MLGYAESQVPKLMIREIIFEEFQRVWSQSTNVTDRRTTSRQYHATLRFEGKKNSKNNICGHWRPVSGSKSQMQQRVYL